ncbi:short chain dehydrogenase reductase family protein [Ophiostoma piceae UAMH 11346]|uniref:Short chain dehydrogenase reductase family protein n=1 Tax=Ophiostoma piceae (strain UAMH 11346) TaxID=1262450 RepID=S3BM58_OPHP1|nr:short chain dehydrogenase reductase family protein [Ophiostoma piceae UAMH 11346]
MADRKTSEPASARQSQAVPPPAFPTHNSPRVWFITQALSPLAVRLIRLLLGHGDYVVACLPPRDVNDEAISAEFRELASECRAAAGGGEGLTSSAGPTTAGTAPSSFGQGTRSKDREGWKDRIRAIRCDGSMMSHCSGAISEAVHIFGRIDILLCCSSAAAIGSVEELDGTSLVGEQFEINFFSHVNFIKAALPQLRAQKTGHIIALSNIGGHIGTPGMPITTAATWALEGYCDSLAYEIAPFNIKVTIVQPQTEVSLLTNKIVFAPVMPEYEASAAAAAAAASSYAATDNNPNSLIYEEESPEPEAPLSSLRGMLFNLLGEYGHPNVKLTQEMLAAPNEPQRRYPQLPASSLDKLLLETVHALAAIGGLENPPTRHIVGFDAAAAVEEKLKTVTEELEDFVETSLSVDIFDSELKQEAREGKAPGQVPQQEEQ